MQPDSAPSTAELKLRLQRYAAEWHREGAWQTEASEGGGTDGGKGPAASGSDTVSQTESSETGGTERGKGLAASRSQPMHDVIDVRHTVTPKANQYQDIIVDYQDMIDRPSPSLQPENPTKLANQSREENQRNWRGT